MSPSRRRRSPKRLRRNSSYSMREPLSRTTEIRDRQCKPSAVVGAVLLVAFLWPPPVIWADFTGRVVGVTDGDTIKVLHNGKAEKIRLHGIDCPEKAQPFGTKAKQFTSAMVFGKMVRVLTHGQDRYGRTVAEV